MDRKFEVGEHLVYGLHGVCRLEEITVDEANGEKTYVLQPLGDKRCRLFIPCGNEICLSKMRKVLSREEAEALILEMPHMEENWISQESQRKMVFADIPKRGDRREIAQLIKTISLTEIRLKEKGIHREGRSPKKGDEYVEIRIAVPRNISPEARKRLEEYAKLVDG